jgi:hypothetical protein
MIATMAANHALRASAQDNQADWRELNAYTLGVQAYIYTFPWSYMIEQRWARSADAGHQANRLFHFRELKDASHLDGGSPNNDRLYSCSWLYLKNEPIEATYLNVSVDGDRKKLSGSNRYIIPFDKGVEPKVKAFWSITMYNLKYNLVANPINCYSVGDRSGMTRDADGGLTIYVQKKLAGRRQGK